MKPTYTREQLEALRDNGHTDGPWELIRIGAHFVPAYGFDSLLTVCREGDSHFGAVYTESDANLIAASPTLLADLLSALDEIERLRTALTWIVTTFPFYSYGDNEAACKMVDAAESALKETTDER